MQLHRITHPSDIHQRVDKFLKKYLPNAPLGMIYRALRTGKIKINAKKVPQDYRLEAGDELSLFFSDEEIQGWQAS